MLHFGIMEHDVFDLISDASGTKPSSIKVDKRKILGLENIRKINLIKTEEILVTFKEGSETDRLMQISNFILENCEYVNALNTDISTFWDKEYGSCTTFALTFKHFANRLGIKCDLIISPGSDGLIIHIIA